MSLEQLDTLLVPRGLSKALAATFTQDDLQEAREYILCEVECVPARFCSGSNHSLLSVSAIVWML